METIALYVGYSVLAIVMLTGTIYLLLIILAQMPRLPYFISYRSLLKKDEQEFEKWVDAVRFVIKNDKKAKK